MLLNTPGEVSDQFQCKRPGGDASRSEPGTSENNSPGQIQRYNYLLAKAIGKLNFSAATAGYFEPGEILSRPPFAAGQGFGSGFVPREPN